MPENYEHFAPGHVPEGERNKYERDYNEAFGINESVDDFFKEHPRSSKSKSEVAMDIIKGRNRKPVFLRRPVEDKGWIYRMQDYGIKITPDGFLKIPNGGAGSDSTAVDVRSAIRMQDHILENYGYSLGSAPVGREISGERESEFSKLESIQDVIEKANDMLRGWGRLSPEEKKDFQNRMTDVVLSLENCRNELKEDLRDEAEEIEGLRDSQGRENPGALAARTVIALKKLQMRFAQIKLIAPAIAVRREILVFEDRRNREHLKSAAKRLAQIRSNVKFLLGESPVLELNQDAYVRKELEKLANSFGSILLVQPYKSVFDQARFGIREIEQDFSNPLLLPDRQAEISEKYSKIIEMLDLSSREGAE